ncbi:2-oxoglutarate synthase [Candidatus Shapirobacteria bacterium CG10_big_fil_rev_8_21_14_0_10_40_9]|uniref:2-oxoglutarate synthase n=1 Tax=Candidatus Shapirobacteria bacterium CG10_big_fil_rev_8_21_14_0_10_40_9 TaxID=1974888 RepID=A0A2M8L3Y4_9BACT|nr:MAG: 2-oxoglutarate synthase [Candidatus Shapirobacteria bacterium CG10_big_fil_rev_8_21_14_0_10_40_9]
MEPNFPKCFKSESKPHKFCPGCGYGIILKNLGLVIDEQGIQKNSVLLTDIGCNLLAWDFFDLPTCQTHHGRTVATAVGFKMADPQKNVLCLIGDGGGYAIGLQNLIHACLRNNPITIILVNNTNYGMTGGQFAPTTLDGQITDSTPFGKDPKIFGKTFKGPELLKTIAWEKAYIARGSTSNPGMLKSYLKTALETQKQGNFSFIEVLSFCPLNWKTDAKETLEKMKELENYFPQGELK